MTHEELVKQVAQLGRVVEGIDNGCVHLLEMIINQQKMIRDLQTRMDSVARFSGSKN